MSDDEVFSLARREQAVLITRDRGFTHSVRFPPSLVGAIFYVRPGNLTAVQEARLIEHFVEGHEARMFAGALVTLSRGAAKILR